MLSGSLRLVVERMDGEPSSCRSSDNRCPVVLGCGEDGWRASPCYPRSPGYPRSDGGNEDEENGMQALMDVENCPSVARLRYAL